MQSLPGKELQVPDWVDSRDFTHLWFLQGGTRVATHSTLALDGSKLLLRLSNGLVARKTVLNTAPTPITLLQPGTYYLVRFTDVRFSSYLLISPFTSLLTWCRWAGHLSAPSECSWGNQDRFRQLKGHISLVTARWYTHTHTPSESSDSKCWPWKMAWRGQFLENSAFWTSAYASFGALV